jgi:two-component system, OmpR family, alkaline phosphatase synthesis response regulator PhoP
LGKKILVIEDELLVQKLVVLNLVHEGFEVEAANNFDGGLKQLTSGAFSLALVDVMLPGGDGFVLTSRARDAGIQCPILMLTARSDTSSKVRGFACGADDYLTKPFDVPELMARVNALLRRANGGHTLAIRKVALGQHWVRFDTGEASTNDGLLCLSEKELKLMELFVANENRALSRTDMLEEVWGMDAFPTDRTIDNFILRLRKLFEPNPEQPQFFLTLRGRGYLFRKSPHESTQ